LVNSLSSSEAFLAPQNPDNIMAYISKTRWHIAKVTFTRILMEVAGFDVHGFPVAKSTVFLLCVCVICLIMWKI